MAGKVWMVKMGIFNPNAPFLVDLNLLIQITILVILAVSLILKFKKKYMEHGATMGIAVALNTVSVLLVMVPSLLSKQGLFEDLTTGFALATISHAILGSLAEILGIYLLATWIFHRHDVKTCFKNKRIMRATTFLWLVELIIGVYIYTILYPLIY
jgi:uncharacterized membrane protein YozB (DUF420 family)